MRPNSLASVVLERRRFELAGVLLLVVGAMAVVSGVPAHADPLPPSAPLSVTAVPGDGEATVSWDPPADPGDSPLTGYQVLTDGVEPASAEVDGTMLTATVFGLTNGQAYTFTVLAVNGAGPGPVSEPSAPVTPAPLADLASPLDRFVANGPINAVAALGDTTYLGGDFTRIGPRAGPVVGVSSVTGAVTDTFPLLGTTAGEDLQIEHFVPDGAGGWYVGGHRFASIGGVPRHGVAHFDAQRRLTAWNPLNAGAQVGALEAFDGVLFVGGTFTSANGQPRSNVAAFDLSTGALLTWAPNVQRTNNPGYLVRTVDAIAKDGATVYLGGALGMVNGSARAHLAAVSYPNGVLRSWNPSATCGWHPGDGYEGCTGPDGSVSSITTDGGSVYVNGAFNLIGDQVRRGFAEIDAAGLATNWDPCRSINTCGLKQKIHVEGSRIFFCCGGLQSFDLTTDDHQTPVGHVLGGGPAFTVNNGVATVLAADRLATVDLATGGILREARVPMIGLAYGMGVSGTEVILAGGIQSVGVAERSRLAAIDQSGRLASWNPGADGIVRTLDASQGTVVIGGEFDHVAGTASQRLAAVDAITGQAAPWAVSPDWHVYDLHIIDSTVYLGGAFEQVSGQDRPHLAAVDLATGDLLPWNPSTNAAVFALDDRSGTIYFGGAFTQANGTDRNRIAAVSSADGTLSGWNPGADDFVRAIAASPEAIYLGGGFTELNGQPRNRLGAVDPTTGLATSWDPGTDDEVWALETDGTTIYAGRTFNHDGGQPHDGLSAINLVGQALAWNPGVGGSVLSLTLINGRLLATGNLTSTSTAAATTEHAAAEADPVGLVAAAVGPYAPPPRPDLRIRRGAGALIGNNIYNTTGTGQTSTGSAARGRSVTYTISAQNDGRFPDRLKIRGQRSTSRFRLVYRNPVGLNITNQVTAGTYTTPVLTTGSTHNIRMTVTVTNTAPRNANVARTVTARSNTNQTVNDTVKVLTRRS